MEWKIPLSDIDLGNEEIQEVSKLLRSKWLSMGEVTARFEEAFASYLGVKHACAVSNGTAALHLANMAMGIGKGDEVIVPSLTFVASANSILYTGATPVFADIKGCDDLNISPESIEEKITERTKGIVVVHYGGYSCSMEEIGKVAKEHDLFIIEDAAHAPGASYKGKMLGTLGNVGCFSFFSNKNMVTGEGGMVVTDDDIIAEKIRRLRSHGMTTLSWDRFKGHAHSYDVVELGYNYRTTDISSAIGIVQLGKLEKNNKKRKELSDAYAEALKKYPKIKLPFSKSKEKSSYHIRPIILSDSIDRGTFIQRLKERGIQTSIHYPPIHLFKYYRESFGYRPGMLPVAEYTSAHEVTLPLHPLMTRENIEYISECIGQVIEGE